MDDFDLKGYNEDFSKIIEMIEKRKNNAYRKINEELVSLYLDIGNYVSEKLQNDKWGSGTVDSLALF